MSLSEAKRLKGLEIENHRLKKVLAESLLENEVAKKAMTAPARREEVRAMVTRGQSERQAL